MFIKPLKIKVLWAKNAPFKIADVSREHFRRENNTQTLDSKLIF